MNEIALLKKTLSFVIIILIVGAGVVPSMSGDKPSLSVSINDDGYDFYVDDNFDSSTPGWQDTCFDSIYDAVRAADKNFKIFVYNGDYAEKISISGVKQGLRLIGESKENTIIKFPEHEQGALIDIASPGTTLNNFTIENNTAIMENDGAIRLCCNDVTISNCIIRNNLEYGIYGIDPVALKIFNCNIYNNKKGIYIFARNDLNSVNISHCKIENNTGNGIECYCEGDHDINNLIFNCSLSNNGDSPDRFGVYLQSCEQFIISNCSFCNNYDSGIFLRQSLDNKIIHCKIDGKGRQKYGMLIKLSNNNYIYNCTIFDNRKDGIYLDESEMNTIENCNITKNDGYGLYLFHLSENNNINTCNVSNENKRGGICLERSSDNNEIFDSNISNNMQNGILIRSSRYNTITRCTLEGNTEFCIKIEKDFWQFFEDEGLKIIQKIMAVLGELKVGGNDNVIYRNVFISDILGGVAFDQCRNKWWCLEKRNDTYTPWRGKTVGNYWYGYHQKGVDIDPVDDIIDGSYYIKNGRLLTGNEDKDRLFINEDEYPLKYDPRIKDWNAPDVKIIYPNGAEHLFGNVNVTWNAVDVTSNLCDVKSEKNELNISIEIFNNSQWEPLPNAINMPNSGYYIWDTMKCKDGMNYRIRINAADNSSEKNEGNDTSSDFFIINNDGPYVSRVIITDTTIDSSDFIGDRHEASIVANIIFEEVNPEDLEISADLSALGVEGATLPINMNHEVIGGYNGITATWYLPEVFCNPSNGLLEVIVTVKMKNGNNDIVSQNSGDIIADNTPPEVYITKPSVGIYLNDKIILFPFVSNIINSSIIMGRITITVRANVMDKYGISDIMWIVDGTPRLDIDEKDKLEWPFYDTIGKHTIKAVVFDNARNMNTAKITVWYFGRLI